MRSVRRRRLQFIILLLVCIAGAFALALYALRQNITLYETPTQLLAHPVAVEQDIRLGGIVLAGSIVEVPHTLQISFVLKDTSHHIKVFYTGILPALFRVGQGIIVEGHLTHDHVFMANQVLAKHDESYHPPGVGAHVT